jgi:hypothetical protein
LKIGKLLFDNSFIPSIENFISFINGCSSSINIFSLLSLLHPINNKEIKIAIIFNNFLILNPFLY